MFTLFRNLDLKYRIIIEVILTSIIIVVIALPLFFSERASINSFPLVSVRVTIPEGYNIRDIARKFSSFKNFDTENFFQVVQNKEGYLFPDTYFLTGKEDEYDVAEMMENNFNKKTVAILPENNFLEIQGLSLDKNDVIIMASILEREAQTIKDKKIVAGVLFNRLRIGMPLQADATLNYISGKTSAEMTEEDLKFDSPYNTYLYKGLPKGPICNPGLESIQAVLSPEKSTYLYYLSDRSDVFHYAETFETHKSNKFKYLR